MIDFNVAKRVTRHVRRIRLIRILHNGNATAILDGGQARRAIVLVTREQDTDDPRAVGLGRGLEKRINRWPMQVDRRTPRQPHAVASQCKVQIGTGHIDAAGSYW